MKCLGSSSFLLASLTVFAVSLTGAAHAQEDATLLVEFQRAVVKRLAGGAEIAPGKLLDDRASDENRAIARTYLIATLETIGLEPLLQPYSESGENVYAFLPATTPSDEYVVLGAHFDTSRRSPGANDNATGSAAVLGVARHLVTLRHRSRNIYLVLFDEEESGLIGSAAFAQMLQDEAKNVVAVHTVDQMGWDADGDRAFELELPYEGAVDLYREASVAADFSSQIHVTQEPGSDHTAFRRLGMSAVGLTEEYRNDDTTPHIHRPTDTWDTVDFEYLATVTRLVQAAMAILVGAR